MKLRSGRWLAVVAAMFALSSIQRADEPRTRPTDWATKIERPGLPNLHKISDGLYRGAQPTAEGLKELEKMGVKTVVNLRSEHSDKEILGKTQVKLETIPTNAWGVKEADVVRFLQIATDKARQPVFVHCQHGADRTGAMCAAYRVAVEGWTKQRALDEMTQGGFEFHSIWSNLPKLIQSLDVERVRTKAGLKRAAAKSDQAAKRKP